MVKALKFAESEVVPTLAVKDIDKLLL